MPVAGTHTSYRRKYFADKCSLSQALAANISEALTEHVQSRKKTKILAVKKKSKNIFCALRSAKKSLATALQQVTQVKEQNNALSEENIFSLLQKQQLHVRTCFLAARWKFLKGMTYDEVWIVECLVMRMWSPKLYEHLQKQGIMIYLVEVCRSTCNNSRVAFVWSSFKLSKIKIKLLRSNSQNIAMWRQPVSFSTTETYQLLLLLPFLLLYIISTIFREKTKIAFDLLHYDSPHSAWCAMCFCSNSGRVEGFMHLGDNIAGDHNAVLADHRMVVLCQPNTGWYQQLFGSWTQILNVFASQGNVKAATLAKISQRHRLNFLRKLVCGLHDGTSRNRSIWRIFEMHDEQIINFMHLFKVNCSYLKLSHSNLTSSLHLLYIWNFLQCA